MSRERHGHRGGRPLRISRHPSKSGHQPGMCNAIRVAKEASNADLALIAAAIPVEWHWMTNRHGERIDRAVWLALAAKVALRPLIGQTACQEERPPV